MSTIHVLHLEDNHLDAELIRRKLDRNMSCDICVVSHREDYEQALLGNIDIILCDCRLPTYDWREAFKVARKHGIPVIVVSGSLNNEQIVETMREGAIDYVPKDRLYSLAPAIKHALKL